MRNTFIAIVILFNHFVYSQNNSAFEIEFESKVHFDSQKDSLNFTKFSANWNDELKERFSTPEKQIVLIKKDSILIVERTVKVNHLKRMKVSIAN